jgi:PTS system galactitol-specific IIB component
MAKKVHICVCCGGGIFTTTVVTEEIENLLRSKKIPYAISPHTITEIPNLTEADVIVATGKTSSTNKKGAPVLIGLPMFTGVGKEEFSQLLLDTIAKVNPD